MSPGARRRLVILQRLWPLQAALQQRLQELGVQEGASEASLAAAQVRS